MQATASTVPVPYYPQELIDPGKLAEIVAQGKGPVARRLKASLQPLAKQAQRDPTLHQEFADELVAELNALVMEDGLFPSGELLPKKYRGLETNLEEGDELEARHRIALHAVDQEFAPHLEIQPYPGPSPFLQEDAFRFFGRRSEATEIVSRVMAHPIVLVHAPSGAGKTSLLNTRIIPELNEQGCWVWGPTRFRGPELGQEVRNPFIHQALLPWRGRAEATREPNATLTDFLEANPLDEDELPAPVVLIFDQFEELFTYYPESWRMREDVFVQFREALASNHLLRILMLVRDDFATRIERFAPILHGKLLRMKIGLERLRPEAAKEAVARPLLRTKRRYAESAVETLVTKLQSSGKHGEILAEFVEPVQLQVVCQKLWNSLDDSVFTITDEQVENLADVVGALQSYYEDSIKAVSRHHRIKEGKLRTWFETHMVTSSGTKGLILEDGEMVGGLSAAVVRDFENAYLLRSEPRDEQKVYELSHDRFVQAILESNAAYRQRVAREAGRKFLWLEERAKEWDQAKRPGKKLFDGAQLRKANHYLGYLESHGVNAPEVLVRMVEASEAAEVRRKAKLRRRMLQLGAVAILGISAGLVATIKANHKAQTSIARLLVRNGSIHAALQEFPHAQLLFDKAYHEQPKRKMSAEDKLSHEARLRLGWGRLGTPIEIFAEEGQSQVLLRHDGRRAVLSTTKEVLLMWLDDGGRRVSRSTLLAGEVNGIWWQPKGERFVTRGRVGGGKAELRIWSSEDGQEVAVPVLLEPGVGQIVMSPDGEWIYWVATEFKGAEFSKQCVRLQVKSAKQETLYTTGEFSLRDSESMTMSQLTLAVGPRRHGERSPRWFVGGPVGELKVQIDEKWKILRVEPQEVGAAITPVPTVSAREAANKHRPVAAAFSPDGSALAVGGADGLLRVWVVNRLGEIDEPMVLGRGANLLGGGGIGSIIFSPDGNRIAVRAGEQVWSWDLDAAIGSEDGLAAIAESVRTVTHGADVYGVDFSSAGNRLATSGRDRQTQIWDWSPSGWVLSSRIFHPGTVSTGRFLPDGERIFTVTPSSGAGDGYAGIWRLPESNWVESVLEFQDSETLVTAHLGGARPVVLTKNGEEKAGDSFSLYQLESSTTDAGNGEPDWNESSQLVSLSRTGDHFISLEEGAARVYAVGEEGESQSVAKAGYTHAWCDSGLRLAALWDTHQRQAEVGTELELWSWAEGVEDARLIKSISLENEQRIQDVAYGPIGRLLCVTFEPWDGMALAEVFRIRKVAEQQGEWSIQSIGSIEHKQRILHVAFNRDGSRIVTTSTYDNAKVYAIGEGLKEEGNLQHSADVGFALFADYEDKITGENSEWLVTCSRDHTARIWDVQNGLALRTELEHDGGVVHAATDGMGLLATASLDGAARIWSLPSGTFIGLLSEDAPVLYVGINPSRVLTVTDLAVRRWNLQAKARPVHDDDLLHAYLELMAARKLDEENALARLSVRELRERWEEVRNDLPMTSVPPGYELDDGHNRFAQILTEIEDGLISLDEHRAHAIAPIELELNVELLEDPSAKEYVEEFGEKLSGLVEQNRSLKEDLESLKMLRSHTPPQRKLAEPQRVYIPKK